MTNGTKFISFSFFKNRSRELNCGKNNGDFQL